MASGLELASPRLFDNKQFLPAAIPLHLKPLPLNSELPFPFRRWNLNSGPFFRAPHHPAIHNQTCPSFKGLSAERCPHR